MSTTKKLKGVGVNSKGEVIVFTNGVFSDVLMCKDKDLEELIIPEGMRHIYCSGNNLKKLNLPSTATYVKCDKGLIDIGNTNLHDLRVVYQ